MDAAKETTILLVRHGETVDNARQIMQGQTQGELNERGREQARQVAERLATDPVDVIIASDLRRAIQTAEIIAAPHRLPVVTTPLLRERDWGGFTGRYIPELRGEVWPDDIESEEALLTRALCAVSHEGGAAHDECRDAGVNDVRRTSGLRCCDCRHDCHRCCDCLR